MNPIARFAVLLSAFLAAAVPPAPASVEASYTGCVMSTEAGDLTFCEPDNCSLLRGKGVGPKLAGHTVTLRGTVQTATNAAPRTVIVSSVVSVGAACSQTCSPRPPGHRGIGPHEKPGSEGGTPGVVARPTPQ